MGDRRSLTSAWRACSAARSLCATALILAVTSCEDGLPAGQTLIVVDTDVPAPELVDRLRVDVYSADGARWIDSRDYSITAREPDAGSVETIDVSGAVTLPMSFALVPERGAARAIVRVRAYRDGKVRDYLGERFVDDEPSRSNQPPPTCGSPATLELGKSVVLGVEPTPRADGPAVICDDTRARSAYAAASVHVETAGSYRLRIDRTTPAGAWSEPLMMLVKNCVPAAPVLACSGGAGSDAGASAGHEIAMELRAGDYVLLIANAQRAAMEAVVTFLPLEPALSEGPPPASAPQHDNTPRLREGSLEDAADVTPPTEPDPAAAIDRLALVAIDSERDRSVSLLLTGDCFGVMADLLPARHSTSGAGRPSTCRDAAGNRQALAPEPFRDGLRLGAMSRSGTWPARARGCEHEHDDGAEVLCVPGGVFVLGDTGVVAAEADAATPERVSIIAPFRIDRFEYSVRRYRELVRSGKAPLLAPVDNDLPLDFANQGKDGNYCTYSADERPEREDLPLTCVSWEAARAICAAEGGSLPSSAAWEYAAAAAGKQTETLYPWGADPPDCSGAVFGRWGELSRGHSTCFATHGFGPSPVVEDDEAMAHDRTPLGIVGLGGNVSEWTSDSHRAYSSACWATSRDNPHCEERAASPLRTVKGGSWRQAAAFTRAPVRIGVPPTDVDDGIGFRCIYPEQGK